MDYFVIGTAGHIDHGKTALVKALTGIDTDRLKEEQLRGITIDLGFAELVLPNGKSLALVDVPGHERFVKNMLAGAAGIDLALLVIAADEGIMPQTREHFDIIRLLEITRLIIVVSKADKTEAGFLELVLEDIRKLIRPTPYCDAPVVPVSVLTGQGIKELVSQLQKEVAALTTHRGGKRKEGPARLPVDRVFFSQGFGTVVTGTLFNGVVSVGDTLEIPTKKRTVRVRNLQVHNKAVSTASAGQRGALNLAGIDLKDIKRGDVLAAPGMFTPTARLDIILKMIEHTEWVLKQQARVRFHHGTKETLGRIRILGQENLKAGEEAFARLFLEEPVVALRGDHYIIRSYSPVQTIGGGCIVETYALQHKTREEEILKELKLKAAGNPEDVIALFIKNRKDLTRKKEIIQYLGGSLPGLDEILEELVKKESVLKVETGDETLYCSKARAALWEESITREIKKHLAANPLEPGLNKESIRTRYFRELSLREYNALLDYWLGEKRFSLIDSLYLTLYGYRIKTAAEWEKKAEDVELLLREKGWQVPTWSSLRLKLGFDEKAGAQLLAYLLRTKKVIRIASDLYLAAFQLEEAKELFRHHFCRGREFTVAEARDLLSTSRKIAVALLEYLDRTGFTVREGDSRRLKATNGGGL